MVLNNLAHRPVRTALSVIAVAVEVLLIISTVGLVTGILDELSRRTRGIGADIIVQPSGSGMGFGFGSAPMPVTIADKLAEVPHVSVVAPVLTQSTGGLTVINGIDDRYRRVTGGFVVLEGRDLRDGLEILADEVYAKSNHVKAGQKLLFWKHEFTVAGIVQSGVGARLYIPLATAQDLLGSTGKCTIFYVRVDDPKSTEETLNKFKDMLEGYNIHTIEEYTSLMSVTSLPGLQPFVEVMITISVVIGFLVIFLAMYTTVLERTREIGVLKSLGASKLYIANLFLREVLMISAVGIVVGIGTSFLLRKIVLTLVPTLSILITGEWLLWAALIAFGGALLGAIYPTWRAARQDPIDALAYE